MIMGVLPPEVLGSSVLFNQKSKHMEERRVVCRVLVGKPESKTPLGIPRRRRK
jgi:hypothetical protein